MCAYKKKKKTKQYSSAGTNLLDKSDTMVFSTLSPQIKSYQTWTTLSDIALLEQFCLSFHKLSFHVIWAFNWYFLSNLTIQYYPLYPMDFHSRCLYCEKAEEKKGKKHAKEHTRRKIQLWTGTAFYLNL